MADVWLGVQPNQTARQQPFFKAGLRLRLYTLSAQLFGSVICAERMQISGADKQTDGTVCLLSQQMMEQPLNSHMLWNFKPAKSRSFYKLYWVTEQHLHVYSSSSKWRSCLKFRSKKKSLFFSLLVFFYLNFIFKRNLCLASKRLFTVLWSSSCSLSRFDLTGKLAYCASRTETIQMCFMLWDTFRQKFMFFKTNFCEKITFSGLPIGR